MDLTSFTQKSSPQIKEEIILDNSDVRIIKIGDEVEFVLRTKAALKKYQNFLFTSPTNAITAN